VRGLVLFGEPIIQAALRPGGAELAVVSESANGIRLTVIDATTGLPNNIESVPMPRASRLAQFPPDALLDRQGKHVLCWRGGGVEVRDAASPKKVVTTLASETLPGKVVNLGERFHVFAFRSRVSRVSGDGRFFLTDTGMPGLLRPT